MLNLIAEGILLFLLYIFKHGKDLHTRLGALLYREHCADRNHSLHDSISRSALVE